MGEKEVGYKFCQREVRGGCRSKTIYGQIETKNGQRSEEARCMSLPIITLSIVNEGLLSVVGYEPLFVSNHAQIDGLNHVNKTIKCACVSQIIAFVAGLACPPTQGIRCSCGVVGTTQALVTMIN